MLIVRGQNFLLRPQGQLVEEARCEHRVDSRAHEWEKRTLEEDPDHL